MVHDNNISEKDKTKNKIKQAPISSPNQWYVVLTTGNTAEAKAREVPAKKVKPTAKMEYRRGVGARTPLY